MERLLNVSLSPRVSQLSICSYSSVGTSRYRESGDNLTAEDAPKYDGCDLGVLGLLPFVWLDIFSVLVRQSFCDFLDKAGSRFLLQLLDFW